jgi:prepilin-type N-terminal cleavage/methylation domain-containing protein
MSVQLKKQTGFTIVELLIVIVIIGILAAITIVAFNGVSQRAITTTLQSDLRGAATQLELAKIDSSDQYPDATILTSLDTTGDNTFDYTSDGTSYCLTAFSTTAGVPSYYISSTTNSAQEGICAGHTDPNAVATFPSTEIAKILASDGVAGDFFGDSVAISGDTAVIGARGDDDAGSASGSAYIFTRSGSSWTQQAKLTASDAAASDNFGWSVAVAGDTAVIAAPRDDSSGIDSGSAYIFTRSGSTWTEQAELTASDGAADDRFGDSVAIFDGTVVIGAVSDDDAGISSGSAYLFE